jgi:hypothetical protein
VIATLRFALPEEQQEHECALRGVETAALLRDVLDRLSKRMNDGAAIDPGATVVRPVTRAERRLLVELHRWIVGEIDGRELRTATEVWF